MGWRTLRAGGVELFRPCSVNTQRAARRGRRSHFPMTTQTVRSFALSAMLALAPLCALAVDAPKAVEPVKLADRIYTFSNTMANSTAIVGDESVILVDSGENPQAAAALQAASVSSVSGTPKASMDAPPSLRSSKLNS